jgi:hypothetical protein
MTRKIGIYALCVVMISQALAGCAGMTEQQKGTATGAGIGAVVGGIAGGLIGGDWKGAAIGAATGAVVGGLVGWGIGEYRARKVKEGQQAAMEKGWTPQQGVVAKIDGSEAKPIQLKPGDQIVLQTQYTVLAPPEQGEVNVKEVRTIFFNNKALHRFEQTSKLSSGTYLTEQPLTLPTDAATGKYTVTTLVEPVVEKATKDQDTIAFTVQPVKK